MRHPEFSRWYAHFACQIPVTPALPKTGQAIGIDVGIAALITPSNEGKVDHPQFYRTA